MISKLGIPHPDQDFMGKRHVESKNIKIQKTRVQGLHAMPMEIPNIQTNDGTMVQGPARDLFRYSSRHDSSIFYAVYWVLSIDII